MRVTPPGRSVIEAMQRQSSSCFVKFRLEYPKAPSSIFQDQKKAIEGKRCTKMICVRCGIEVSIEVSRVPKIVRQTAGLGISDVLHASCCYRN